MLQLYVVQIQPDGTFWSNNMNLFFSSFLLWAPQLPPIFLKMGCYYWTIMKGIFLYYYIITYWNNKSKKFDYIMFFRLTKYTITWFCPFYSFLCTKVYSELEFHIPHLNNYFNCHVCLSFRVPSYLCPKNISDFCSCIMKCKDIHSGSPSDP